MKYSILICLMLVATTAQAGSVKCPAIIADKTTGEYKKAKAFKCYTSAKDAKKAGYFEGENSSGAFQPLEFSGFGNGATTSFVITSAPRKITYTGSGDGLVGFYLASAEDGLVRETLYFGTSPISQATRFYKKGHYYFKVIAGSAPWSIRIE